MRKIEVDERVYEILSVIKHPRETFNDVLHRLFSIRGIPEEEQDGRQGTP